MFKVQKVYIESDENIQVDVLDTVDNTVDVVPLDLLEAFLDLDIKISGVYLDESGVQFEKDVKMEYANNLENESDELESMYNDEEDDESVYEEYEDGYEEDTEGFYYEEDEDEDDMYYSDMDKGNMYDFIEPNRAEIIKNYYRYYTKRLYSNLASTVRLGMSTKKAEQLAHIKNLGTTWSFTGITDCGSVCSCCTLGHEIRYEYHAENEYGEDIIFGRDCVRDFFNLDENQLKNLTKTQNEMTSEAFEIIKKTSSGEVGIGKEGLDFLYEVLYALDEQNKLKKYIKPSLLKYLEGFINNDIALPKSMVKELKKQIVSRNCPLGVYEVGTRAYDSIKELLNDVLGGNVEYIDVLFGFDTYNGSAVDLYKRFLAYAFKNRLDGVYAHDPIKGVCKEEGSCRKERRLKWKRNEMELVFNNGFRKVGLEEVKNYTEYVIYFMRFYNFIKKIPSTCDNAPLDNIPVGIVDKESYENTYNSILGSVLCFRDKKRSRQNKNINHELLNNLNRYFEIYLSCIGSEYEKLGYSKDAGAENKEDVCISNGRYTLDKDTSNKINSIINAYNSEKGKKVFEQNKKTFIVQIAETVKRNNWYSDKQEKYLNMGVLLLKDNNIELNNTDSDEIKNDRYSLDDNEELREMIERLYNSELDTEMYTRINSINNIIYPIVENARRYKSITDRQLRFVKLGIDELNRIESER